MYDWRKMTEAERGETLRLRRRHRSPDHSPPHREMKGEHTFLITAACFEHAPIIGASPGRMTSFSEALLETCRGCSREVHAWCVLPNHYHLLATTEVIADLRRALGQNHGRTSFRWNAEDRRRGRQIWCNCMERPMRSENHFLATINYIHHNPVKHGHVERWQDWPWSSAADFLEQMGHEEAVRLWKEYPILDYGKKWDL